MPAVWTLALVIITAFAATSAADSGDDFSNNLFSDLAPLLALFGERVTMQFMSQSTGWADNIILAMAPLGIITIIASAIRVGGPSWLKAIIGRARENLAVAEAESMSSTSHEVCELWNGQEVVRCIGSPSTTEFICLRPAKMDCTRTAAEQLPDILELEEALSKRYLREIPSNDWAGFWEKSLICIGYKHAKHEPANSEAENGEKSQKSTTIPVSKVTIVRNKVAAAPNISLNSHSRFSRGELRAVAVLGTLLQLGVLTYSGFATYHPALKFAKGDGLVAGYAFPCTAAGTIVLVAGLLLCAHVVESSTEEERYQPSEGTKARLVWLQKTETVDDQSFQSFALSAGDDQKLITTSCRADKQSQAINLELKTIIGTAISLCGFVVQFIGLRGMHWSASVVQLGAVIAMAALRAWVRRGLSQPLDWVRLTPGYELEWFAATLGDFDETPRQRGRGPKAYKDQGQATRAGVSSKKNGVSNSTSHNVMVTRRSLCDLASWQGPASAEALTLARAIKIAMDALSSYLPEGDFIWSLEAHLMERKDKPPEFRWPREVTIESLQKDVEAALSLRLYRVYSQQQESQRQSKSTQTQSHKYNAQLRANELPAERGLRLLGPGTRALRRDLAWWMPPDTARILEIKEDKDGMIKVENHRIVGYEEQQAGGNDRDGSRTRSTSHHGIGPARYNGAEASLSPDDTCDGEIEELESALLASESYDSLELLYAQDMFTKFMKSVAEKMTRAIEGGANVRPKDSSSIDAWKCFTLHNDRLSKMALDIHNSGFGNLHQIYLSVIQPLSTEGKLPEPDNIVALAQKHAKLHQRLEQFEKAGNIYLWLFRTANTFPKESRITIKAIAMLMEHLRTVTLRLKLWEAQYYGQYHIGPLSEIKSNVEKELETVDRRVLLCLMSLYKKQRRQWECDILQNAGPTIEGHTSYPETFNFTQLHQECVDMTINPHELQNLARRGVNWKDIHDWTPLHYAAASGNCDSVYSLLHYQADTNARDLLDWTPLHYACNAAPHDIHLLRVLLLGRQVNVQGIDGVAPLHCAAMNGRIQMVEMLIETGAALDIQDTLGNTALHWAAFMGHGAVVQYLYEGSNKKLRDNRGRIPLHLAVMSGMDHVVPLLVPGPDKQMNARADMEINDGAETMTRSPGDCDTRDVEGYTPLHWAVKGGHEDIVRYLFGEAGANTEVGNIWDRTPLHAAAIGGYEAIVRYLVGEAGTNTEVMDAGKGTPLYIAVKKGHEAIVRYLIGEAGANTEVRDVNGDAPLHIAAEEGHEAIVRYLVGEAGANTEVENTWKRTPLHAAAIGGYEAIVRYLFGEAGANTEVRDVNGDAPLHDAAMRGYEAIVRYLVGEAGANTEVRDANGDAPLHDAAEEGHEAIVRYLVGEAGANKEARTLLDQTPLHIAAYRGQEAIVRYLVGEAGANKEARTLLDQTPLHIAAYRGQEAIVRYLVREAGANKEARNSEGKTPAQLAAEKNYSTIAKILE